jgi:glycosyltransferase involved in cell wall biosynthesis
VIITVIQSENQLSKGIEILSTYVWPRVRGKYIALCEGDDYWTDPLKLQKQVDFLEANPDYVICYHNARIIDNEGNVISESKLPEESERDFSMAELITGTPFILTLSICYRNVVKDFPEEFNKVINGDNFLISLLGSFGKGKYLTNILPAVYRKHEGGIWSMKTDKDKMIATITTFYWLFQYYKRIGKIDFANSCLDFMRYKIDNLDPKGTVPVHLNLAGRMEASMIRFIENMFKFISRICAKRK